MSHRDVTIFFIYLILHPDGPTRNRAASYRAELFLIRTIKGFTISFLFPAPPPPPISCSLEERVFNTRCTSTFNPVSSKPCVSLHFKLNYTRTPLPMPPATPLLAFVPLCPSSISLFVFRRFGEGRMR